MLRSPLIALAALSLAAHAAAAQERDKERENVPPGQRPPPGLCRIWLHKVPANQQPAPTDCANAIRNRPDGARIIFPEERSAQRFKLPIPSLTRGNDNDRVDPRARPKQDEKEKKGKKDKEKPEKP